eukprot:10977381-Heterocapsa_arctica.AAC.1
MMRSPRRNRTSKRTRRMTASNRLRLPHVRKALRHYWRISLHPQLDIAKRRKSTCPLFPLAPR